MVKVKAVEKGSQRFIAIILFIIAGVFAIIAGIVGAIASNRARDRETISTTTSNMIIAATIFAFVTLLLIVAHIFVVLFGFCTISKPLQYIILVSAHVFALLSAILFIVAAVRINNADLVEDVGVTRLSIVAAVLMLLTLGGLIGVLILLIRQVCVEKAQLIEVGNMQKYRIYTKDGYIVTSNIALYNAAQRYRNIAPTASDNYIVYKTPSGELYRYFISNRDILYKNGKYRIPTTTGYVVTNNEQIYNESLENVGTVNAGVLMYPTATYVLTEDDRVITNQALIGYQDSESTFVPEEGRVLEFTSVAPTRRVTV